MPNAAVKAAAYSLNHTPELALWYGNTPYVERLTHPDSEFLRDLPKFQQNYHEAASYAPNQTYIGAMEIEDFEKREKPWYKNLEPQERRYGRYGEIMPEDETIAFMDICDVFDLIWLEKGFAASIREKLAKHPLMRDDIIARLEAGHEAADIEDEIKTAAALPLYVDDRVIGCARRGHEVDPNLTAYELLVNIANKASAVLSLLHLIKNAGMKPEDVDFVVECSEEAAGDMNQRGGGNFAKAIAEIAGCANASGCDVRGFCAGPVNAIIAAASMVAAGAHKNVAVVAGGAIPKLYMNARDHVKKELPALENCIGSFGVLVVPEDGALPVIRLDAIGKHTVGAGASPQTVTTVLTYDPLKKVGLTFADVDKFSPELHNPEITLPAGAGDVPTANFKMIAALAVMKKAIEKADMVNFTKEHGMTGFVHTQGHIPSGVPFIGHAADAINAGKMTRAMIIGKGSLFLGRLTNLADGASFLIEKPQPKKEEAAVGREEIRAMILESLGELAAGLKSR
ncbi:glycine/sarcosine/betaine reductase complex component C subunit beta [Synergistes jonesii]|uniref:Glycine reductase n=1 Tax=Synergistes jonesii TaxID=2754 RepID=A0A073IQC4_9BACT|nr:glycine/sarcosine/betaine reductase complex component C subunit beta [Synergistes jonesii]KEJ91790.1 glycine reductase [Synergistes jonesii]OFB61580.1 glycine reductase [Synergistes jonesii]OFB62156.1 glycine reductase [Synergistes jonesii]OFB65811.1 glycine reductase [Synergistes jonesii]OFB67162.1 glycine reductase [Synergistes jonesii]